MSRVVVVPQVLDYPSFEKLVTATRSEDTSRLLLDARRVEWVSPYGLLGLLAIGQDALRRTKLAPLIEAPVSPEVRSYVERMHFWTAAADVFEAPVPRRSRHGEATTLLEVTPIRSHEDVHRVVEAVRLRAQGILHGELHFPRPSVIHFSIMLSEVCQNILEHAESTGWVCAQLYRSRRRWKRLFVKLAVMDVGVGFHGSLGTEHARQGGGRWSAAAALEAAFLRGESRFADPGRGQGLQAIRRQVIKWDGSIRIRSGDARIARLPEWDSGEPLRSGLPYFPGAQIEIVLPENTN